MVLFHEVCIQIIFFPIAIDFFFQRSSVSTIQSHCDDFFFMKSKPPAVIEVILKSLIISNLSIGILSLHMH